jgi:hypothetical protein
MAAYEASGERAILLAANRSVRRGVGISFHGVRGKGHGGVGLGLEVYGHTNDDKE